MQENCSLSIRETFQESVSFLIFKSKSQETRPKNCFSLTLTEWIKQKRYFLTTLMFQRTLIKIFYLTFIFMPWSKYKHLYINNTENWYYNLVTTFAKLFRFNGTRSKYQTIFIIILTLSHMILIQPTVLFGWLYDYPKGTYVLFFDSEINLPSY
jgi:hypothetical protein